MSRWKQVLRCSECGHRAWREVEVDTWHPKPDLDALLKSAYCRRCNSRAVTGRQYDIGWRHFDQLRPGGMRAGLVTFEGSEQRDADIRLALAEYLRIHGKPYRHPQDDEFGGAQT